MKMGVTASGFPELNMLSSGELHSLYPRFLRKFANKIVRLELIIWKQSTMTGVILDHTKLFLQRSDKSYLQNWGR